MQNNTTTKPLNQNRMKQIEITPEIIRMILALDAMIYTIKFS
jgi:hypothetical protein